jgi:hypothetical protein
MRHTTRRAGPSGPVRRISRRMKRRSSS